MTELVSSILHLLGALAALTAALPLFVRYGQRPALRCAAALHVFCVVFMLSMSGLYHLACQLYGDMTAPSEVLRRMDHIGVWLAMAGFFVLPHLVLFRGAWRWGPLLGVWIGALTGIAMKVVWFGHLGRMENFALYAALSSLGMLSTARLLLTLGLRRARWLLVFWAGFMGGAVFFVLRPPDLVAGVFGHHEVWHLGVLLGTYAHWRFVLQISERATDAFPERAPATVPASAG